MSQSPKACVVATIMDRTVAEIESAIDEAALAGADAAEVRFDAAPGVAPEEIGASSSIPLIATVRARRDGGAFDEDEEARVRLLERAEATGRFRLDVERGSAAERIQRERPAAVAVLSRHDHEGTPADLDALARDLLGATRPGQVAKIVTTARQVTDVLRVRETLDRAQATEGRARRSAQVLASGNGHPASGHGRLAAFAMGEAGIASRILSGIWGSAAIWAAARDSAPGAPGQVPLTALLELYRFRALTPDTRIYAVAGSPIGGSLSPVLHNAEFRRTGADSVYIPLSCASAEELATMARELPLAGASVTAPLKVAVMRLVTDPDPSITRAGACNTLVFEGDTVRGFNTDGPAAVEEIRAHAAVEGREALVVGAGGAARAIALALAEAGAHVRIANRGGERGAALARLLGTEALRIEAIDEDPGRILVQATSAPLQDPVVPPHARRAAFVLDIRYGEHEPALVREARATGIPTADGLGMLVRQAAAQLRLFTGAEVPLDFLFEAVRVARDPR
jgi:3-dehydroquinate dehydratase/shikimate dehydrogenase